VKNPKPKCCSPTKPIGDPDWQCQRKPMKGLPFCRSHAAAGIAMHWRELLPLGLLRFVYIGAASAEESRMLAGGPRIKLVLEPPDDQADPVIVWDATFAELEWISELARAAGDPDVADHALRLWVTEVASKIG
jgi:hypothetical protein